MSAPKCVWRLPPCPDYDVEGTESWLTDMASQGLHLTGDSFFLGFGMFEKGEPRQVRYRLEAAEKTTSMWAEDGGYPTEDAVELSRDLGWEYVTNRGQFYIYRCAESGVRELNTDPEVQALALDIVCKRQRSNLWRMIANILFWLILHPLLNMKGTLLLSMIALRSWFFLWGVGLLLWGLGRSTRQVLHLHTLKRQLQTDGHIDHRKDWRKKARSYHMGNFLRRGLICLWFVCLLTFISDHILEKNLIPLSDFTGDPPFATMADLARDKDSYELDNMGFSNTVEERSDWLAPVNIDWNEIARATLPDGRHIEGGLYVTYHQTRSPSVAKAIAKEYLARDRHEYSFSLYFESDFQLLELAPLDVDYAVAYTARLHYPTVVLQDGNRVLRAYWYQTSEDKLSLDEWASILAQSITTTKEASP